MPQAPGGAITTGSQLEDKVKMGPMVREKKPCGSTSGSASVARAPGWSRAASAGRHLHSTIVADKPEMRISAEELFGPAVAVTPFDEIDQAIALANDSLQPRRPSSRRASSTP